jgi:DNA polymerase III delta prime subunit
MVIQTFGDFTCYYKSAFFGRDASQLVRTYRNGETKTIPIRPTPGLTQWVANNFEVLGFDTPAPSEIRRVNKENRATWAPFALQYLERLFDGDSQRHYVLRRSMEFKAKVEFKAKDQWALFPHPDEAKELNLVGMKGDIPLTVVSISVSRKDASVQRLIFDTIQYRVITKIDANDEEFLGGIYAEDRDDYDIWDLESVPVELPATMRAMKSTKKEVNNRLADWTEYLDAMYDANRNNEWGAQILSIDPPTRDRPEYIFKLRCLPRIFHQISSRRNQGGRLHGITNDHSDDDKEWKRKEDSQNKKATRGDTQDAGKFIKVRGEPEKTKDGMFEFFLRVKPPVEENPMIGLGEDYIGMFLINDVSLDLIQIDRQRNGFERLQELEADNNVHDWLFDIKKAATNPRNLPELEFPTLSPMNEEQELAVRGALAAEDVYLIQGPPGTGKTTVISEIINQATEKGERVLLASQSNLAVDNALGRFANTPNIRPIRRYSKSAEIDPEAEKFLEANVIKDFFVPSIRNHCEGEQAKSDSLFASRKAILEVEQTLPMALDEITTQEKSIALLETNKVEFMAELDKQQLNRERLVQQQTAMQAVKHHLGQDTLDGITETLATSAGFDYQLFQAHKTFQQAQQNNQTRIQICELMENLPLEQIISPLILKLERDKDQAITDENYLLADEIKQQLDKERKNTLDSGDDWVRWTKRLDRLNNMLELPYDQVNDLTSRIEQPANLKELAESILSITNTPFFEILMAQMSLDGINSELDATISNVRAEMLAIEKVLEEVDMNIQTNQESLERTQRKHGDAIQHFDTLLGSLPDEVSADATSTGADLPALQVRAQAWLSANNSNIEADSIWRNIRNDWLTDLEEPKKSTLEDLETMYTQMVNVEGVTTSFAGKFAWFSQHLKSPFDIVIIDEISKATPPEILLPVLLGKKAVLVGDHRQLPPTFKDPTSKSREEVQADEIEDERFSRGGKFERMVTSALFAEYFKEAHPSLKVTLLKQYRMHGQIRKCINEFYEGKLTCGLLEDQQTRLKQHGFHLKKKDSGGTSLREGSDLITPEHHVVWVDSTFDRDGKYCQETRPETTTSRRNVREVHLAKYMLDEFEEQIASKKDSIDSTQWSEDPMLRHLDHEQRLPVGFITFYADQKRAFREIANEGDSWSAMRNRWPNLSVRADTVDKFQGGERPVVFVSMVTSPEVKGKGKKEAFEAKVAKYSYNPRKVSSKQGGFKDGGINTTGTPFVRSPERINVAFSRAQNLLIILGNRFTLEQVNDVRIERDDGSVVKKSMYKNIQQTIGKGGMIDGRTML